VLSVSIRPIKTVGRDATCPCRSGVGNGANKGGRNESELEPAMKLIREKGKEKEGEEKGKGRKREKEKSRWIPLLSAENGYSGVASFMAAIHAGHNRGSAVAAEPGTNRGMDTGNG